MVCFEPEGPQESTEELGNRLRTTGVALGPAGHQRPAGARVDNCIHAWALFYT